MDFDDDNILHKLERPPSKNNLSVYTIVQIIIMLCIGCVAGYDLCSLLVNLKFSLSNLFQIVIDTLLFIGLCISAFGFLKENNGHLKGGFLLFYLGCLLLLFKLIIGFFKIGFSFSSLITLLIILCILFVITKQIQHI